MKSLKFLLLSTLVLAACSDKSAQNSSAQNAAVNAESGAGIVGGTEVHPGDKEMVSTIGLYDTQGKFICTGTLISANLVLTAGHCIGEDPTKMIVIFKDKFSDMQKEDVRPVVAAKRNELYMPTLGKNTGDIAVIRFDVGAGLPAGYAPAKVLPDFSLLKKGANVVVTGYGLNWSWVVSKGAGTLRTTELQVADEHFSETEISLHQSVKRGVCSGDSGGPGYMNINGQLYVWGVVSRGDSLPIPLTPNCFIFSVFTRVDVYAPWIVQASNELNSK